MVSSDSYSRNAIDIHDGRQGLQRVIGCDSVRRQSKRPKPERPRRRAGASHGPAIGECLHTGAAAFNEAVLHTHLAVVALALGGIRQDGVGMVDPGQPLIGDRVARVLVGVVVLGQAALGGLDHVAAGARAHLQRLIKCVFIGHGMPPPFPSRVAALHEPTC